MDLDAPKRQDSIHALRKNEATLGVAAAAAALAEEAPAGCRLAFLGDDPDTPDPFALRFVSAWRCGVDGEAERAAAATIRVRLCNSTTSSPGEGCGCEAKNEATDDAEGAAADEAAAAATEVGALVSAADDEEEETPAAVTGLCASVKDAAAAEDACA